MTEKNIMQERNIRSVSARQNVVRFFVKFFLYALTKSGGGSRA